MKKVASALLSIFLVFSFLSVGAFAAQAAVPTSSAVLVNGETVPFEAYNIDGNNYFKLRDLAKVFSSTAKQFEVGWDTVNNAIGLTSGSSYTPVGGELSISGGKNSKSAILSSASVYLDGSKVNLTAYNIDGYNYFKLRDVGKTMNFGVDWDSVRSTISIDTSKEYSIPAALSVHFLDVGQGDSTFIVLPSGKTMLIDAGESQYGNLIVNYIKAKGYSTIDYLIATHPHADHIGGMSQVIEQLQVSSVYMPNATTTTQTYTDLLTAIKNAGLQISIAKAGVYLVDSDNLAVSILAPNSTQYEDLNNYSAVIQLTYKNNAFLFMGDAETLSENEITADVNADVLKIGHHGSDSSTGQAFLNKVLPKYAVISVGAENSYGHPTEATLNKLSAAGVMTYRTDKDGTIVFTSDGTNISVDKTPTAPTTTGPVTPTPPPTNTAVSKPNVMISKVDKSGELVTIKNSGATDIDLSGWVLVSVTGNQRYTFPSYTLKAGAQVTVASGDAAGNLKWTNSNVWNNSSSDPAQLYDAQGNLVASYAD